MLIASSYFSSSCNDERAVGAVLKFLKNTEMGSREGARERERELEWQKKRRDKTLEGKPKSCKCGEKTQAMYIYIKNRGRSVITHRVPYRHQT